MICLNLHLPRSPSVQNKSSLRYFPSQKKNKNYYVKYFNVILKTLYTFLDDCMYTNDNNTDMQAQKPRLLDGALSQEF